jgi:hypothetical protein
VDWVEHSCCSILSKQLSSSNASALRRYVWLLRQRARAIIAEHRKPPTSQCDDQHRLSRQGSRPVVSLPQLALPAYYPGSATYIQFQRLQAVIVRSTQFAAEVARCHSYASGVDRIPIAVCSLKNLPGLRFRSSPLKRRRGSLRRDPGPGKRQARGMGELAAGLFRIVTGFDLGSRLVRYHYHWVLRLARYPGVVTMVYWTRFRSVSLVYYVRAGTTLCWSVKSRRLETSRKRRIISTKSTQQACPLRCEWQRYTPDGSSLDAQNGDRKQYNDTLSRSPSTLLPGHVIPQLIRLSTKIEGTRSIRLSLRTRGRR